MVTRTSADRATALTAVPSHVEAAGPLTQLAGGIANERWFQTLVNPEAEAFVAARWDAEGALWEWLSDDRLTWNKNMRGRSVDLADITPRVQVQLLVGFATDSLEGYRAQPSITRTIARTAGEIRASSLEELDPTQLAQIGGPVLRRWLYRIAVADADPLAEWLRDEVRIAVIRPGAGVSSVLPLGQISQPWLRDLATEVLKTRTASSSVGTLKRLSTAAVLLSRFLDTRGDRGRDPSKLSAPTMTAFAAALYSTPTHSDAGATATLRDLSSLINRGRELGIVDRHQLSTSFVVRMEHIRTRPVRIESDRSIPLATLRLLLGSDDALGSRSLSLAESLGSTEFSGKVFRSYVILAAQFGRRPEELAALRADRLRPNDSGASEMLYDNFKSGRSHVWLPVDAHAAAFVKDWTGTLRKHFPDTPLSELALFPRPTRNPRGTRAADVGTFGAMFRRWITLLEQAIVLAHLHRSTGLSVEVLVQLRTGDLRDGHLHIGSTTYTLDESLRRDLVDYVSECQARMADSKYCPLDIGDVPMFRDPGTRPSKNFKSPDPLRTTTLSRFDALGEDWLDLAAQYPCAGIPGLDLGQRRINPDGLQIRLFRHTYLQHLVNIGVDIFIVQELADHANVQTTIDSYVRVNAERLREAMDLLAQHRIGWLGRMVQDSDRRLQLPSQTTRDMGTNDCNNPKVLDLGNAGCDLDRLCFSCDHYVADPSNMPDMKSEIHTINVTLARLRATEQTAFSHHHAAVLLKRREGWEGKLQALQHRLDGLPIQERTKVLAAAEVVREFRNRTRNGGINVGGLDLS